MFRFVIFSVLFFVGTSALADASNPCCISQQEREHLLALPYTEFDQDQHGGWRKLGQDFACYDLAAQLLERYREENSKKLKPGQIGILSWHAGQLYGFDGQFDKARTRFVASYNLEEPKDVDLLWNDYVIASIAFLDHDLETLKAHRNRIARAPGYKPNLSFVDNLLKYFDSPYGVAYSGGQEGLKPQRCQK